MTQQFSDVLLPALAERPGRDLAMMSTHAPWWTNWLDSSTSIAPSWSGESGEVLVAHQTVHHSSRRPSRVTLPIIPRPELAGADAPALR